MRNATQAVQYLKRADPVLRRIIERVGPCRLEKELAAERAKPAAG